MRIPTNFPHLEVSLDVWKRIYILLGKRGICKVEKIERKNLEAIGLSPDFWVIIDALKKWYENKVPTFIGFLLWLVRSRQREDGGWIRKVNIRIAETGVAYRYIQLATLVGETLNTDVHIINTINWLYRNILPEGGFGTSEVDFDVDIGSTARTVRILIQALLASDEIRNQDILNKAMYIIKSAFQIIKKSEVSIDDLICWRPRPFRKNGKCSRGSTFLSALAYLEVLRILKMESNSSLTSKLKSIFNDIFGKKAEAEKYIKNRIISVIKWANQTLPRNISPVEAEIDNLGYLLKILYNAMQLRIISFEDTMIRSLYNRLKETIFQRYNIEIRRRNYYYLAFLLRALSVILLIEQKILGDTNNAEEARRRIIKILNILVGDESIESNLSNRSDTYHLLLIGISIMESIEALEIQSTFIAKEHNEYCNSIYYILYRFPKNPPPFMYDKIIKGISTPSELLYKFANTKFTLKIISFLVKIDILLLPAIFFAQYALLKTLVELNIISAIIDIYNLLASIHDFIIATIISFGIFICWVWIQISMSRRKVTRILMSFGALIISIIFFMSHPLAIYSSTELKVLVGISALTSIIIDAISKYIKKER